MKGIKKGDKIYCMGITVTVAKVIFDDCFHGYWDVDFIDTDGNHRHWSQYYDEGFLIRKKKRALDWYGEDCTDLYIKYGQPI